MDIIVNLRSRKAGTNMFYHIPKVEELLEIHEEIYDPLGEMHYSERRDNEWLQDMKNMVNHLSNLERKQLSDRILHTSYDLLTTINKFHKMNCWEIFIPNTQWGVWLNQLIPPVGLEMQHRRAIFEKSSTVWINLNTFVWLYLRAIGNMRSLVQNMMVLHSCYFPDDNHVFRHKYLRVKSIPRLETIALSCEHHMTLTSKAVEYINYYKGICFGNSNANITTGDSSNNNCSSGDGSMSEIRDNNSSDSSGDGVFGPVE